MSKIVDQLTPEDFGKSFDLQLFSEWKKLVEEHEKASTINIVLYAVGMVFMIALGGFVGIGLFFGLSITGIVIAMPKHKKRKECQRQLGISNNELKEAIKKCRNQMNSANATRYPLAPNISQPETDAHNVHQQWHDNAKNHRESPKASLPSLPEYSWIQWFFKALRHYADFSGRARRKEYWMFMLFNLVFYFAWSFMAGVMFVLTDGNEENLMITIYSYFILTMLPSMAVTVRRLHDIGKSGWWCLISLIPIIGGIWLLVLMVTEGQQGDNEYGPDPKTSPESFSDRSKLTSVGVTLILASSVALIMNLTFSWIIPAIFHEVVPFSQISFFVQNILRFAAYLILLITGIYLLNEKTISEMQVKKNKAFTMLLTAVSIFVVLGIFYLAVNFKHIQIIAWNNTIHPIINLLSCLSVALFAASILFSQGKELIRKAAITVIVCSGLYLLWSVYFNMSIEVQEPIYQLQNLFILMPAAFIVLAGTFLSRKNQSSVSVSVSASATVNGNKNIPTKAMNSVPEKARKPYIVLVHKIGSMYHRIDEEQKITGDYAEIGRDAKCQVRYDDHFETVSRRHAAIMKDDNHWKLLPLSRTNPTFINGKMVQKEWYLQDGDEIQCSINGPKLVFVLKTNGL